MTMLDMLNAPRELQYLQGPSKLLYYIRISLSLAYGLFFGHQEAHEN